MNSLRRRPGAPTAWSEREQPVFVFDGECPFCSTCARFIVRWIPTGARIVAWQLVDIGDLGLTRDQVEESVQWVGPDGRRSSGAEAIADLLRSSSMALWRGVGRLLAERHILMVARPAYTWVLTHRHLLPLGPAIMELPPSEQRRFGDAR